MLNIAVCGSDFVLVGGNQVRAAQALLSQAAMDRRWPQSRLDLHASVTSDQSPLPR